MEKNFYYFSIPIYINFKNNIRVTVDPEATVKNFFMAEFEESGASHVNHVQEAFIFCKCVN